PPSSVTSTTCPAVPPISGKRLARVSMPRCPSVPGISMSAVKVPPRPTASPPTITSRATQAPTIFQRREAIRRPRRYRDEDTRPPGRAQHEGDDGPLLETPADSIRKCIDGILSVPPHPLQTTSPREKPLSRASEEPRATCSSHCPSPRARDAR